MRARLLTPRATGMPDLDAQNDFRRARRAYATARAWRWATRRRSRSRPATFLTAGPVHGGRPRLQVVPLSQIVGTVDLTSHFDACLRPASELVRRRWERVALAQRRGIPLPPIELVQGPDGYYIIDGRHRVSVAHTLHLADIDAWVYGPVHGPVPASQTDGSPRHSPASHARLTETEHEPASA